MRVVALGRRPVLLCRVSENEFRAIANTCPHEGALLSDGRLTGTTLPSEVGEYKYGRVGEIVRCPWHAYEFDTKSGEALFGERKMRVKTYPVRISDGRVHIDDGRDSRSSTGIASSAVASTE
jgi:nitrite reductase/ring-hydroxylating ferredoxin subunit